MLVPSIALRVGWYTALKADIECNGWECKFVDLHHAIIRVPECDLERAHKVVAKVVPVMYRFDVVTTTAN